MPRIPFLTVIAIAIVFGCIFTPPLPVSAAPSTDIGISTGGSLLNMQPQSLRRRLYDMHLLGVRWVRVDFSWTVIQPHGPNSYDFRFHDRVVAAARRAGIKVLGVFTYTPSWAASPRCLALSGRDIHSSQKCAPRDPQAFARFAQATANHFRHQPVDAWEIWNEPNILGYWREVNQSGQLEVDPVAYGELASQTAQAIHRVNPFATVLTGGLAPMFEPSSRTGMRQSDFLRAMLPHLSRGSVTAIGLHPYSWPAQPQYPADWNAFYSVDSGRPEYNLKAILLSYGRQDLQIWATEFGASTRGNTILRTARSRPDHVSADDQANILAQGITAWHHKPGVGPLFIYTDTDAYLPGGGSQSGFGLRRRDGSPKPAYFTVRRAIASI